MTDLEIRKELAIEQGQEAIRNAAATLRRAARDLEQDAENFDKAENMSQKVARLNHIINYLASNVLGNTGIERLARAQTEIAICNELYRMI